MAFCFATSIVFLEMSVAWVGRCVSVFAVIAMHPDPVPISMIVEFGW